MPIMRFTMEKPRPFRNILIVIAIGLASLLIIDYLFSGMAPFLGFIVAAIVIIIFSRR